MSGLLDNQLATVGNNKLVNKAQIIMMNNKVSFFLIVVILFSCSSDEGVQETVIRPVRTLVINSDSSASTKTFSGVSRSTRTSRLSFKVSGTVETIPVKAGDRIKAGTVIATLDPSTYQLQFQQTQATVAQLKAASRNARATYERTRSLYANSNAPLSELDASRANSESADAQLHAAQKSLELAQLNLSYTNLTVDVDCVVDAIAIEVNENVSTNSEIAQVNCSDELEIEVAVPESLIGKLSEGKQASIQFDTIPERTYSGRVMEVGSAVSGVGSTFPVTVLIEKKDSAIRTGLAASVSFITSDSINTEYVLPLSAVVKGSHGTFVYVVEPQSFDQLNTGVVKKRQVTIGELQSAGIKIRSGLNEGDRVVIAGTSFMRDELLVAF